MRSSIFKNMHSSKITQTNHYLKKVRKDILNQENQNSLCSIRIQLSKFMTLKYIFKLNRSKGHQGKYVPTEVLANTVNPLFTPPKRPRSV